MAAPAGSPCLGFISHRSLFLKPRVHRVSPLFGITAPRANMDCASPARQRGAGCFPYVFASRAHNTPTRSSGICGECAGTTQSTFELFRCPFRVESRLLCPYSSQRLVSQGSPSTFLLHVFSLAEHLPAPIHIFHFFKDHSQIVSSSKPFLMGGLFPFKVVFFSPIYPSASLCLFGADVPGCYFEINSCLDFFHNCPFK